jgi:hypothetical protein
VTTLIREWGTRSGLQAVLQIGGQTNFGPSAEALLTQFDDAPQLIVIADGDGDPEAARQQITNDLIQRAAAAEVLVVEPTLETSLGIFKPGDFSASSTFSHLRHQPAPEVAQSWDQITVGWRWQRCPSNFSTH